MRVELLLCLLPDFDATKIEQICGPFDSSSVTTEVKHVISHNSCVAAMHLSREVIGLHDYKALTALQTLERV